MTLKFRSWNIERKARLIRRSVSEWSLTPEGRQYIKMEYPNGWNWPVS